VADTKIGIVTHFYSNLNVATVKLEKDISVGDTIAFKGNTTDFTEQVSEMQYNHQDVKTGQTGQEVGIKVSEKVREGDEVHLA